MEDRDEAEDGDRERSFFPVDLKGDDNDIRFFLPVLLLLPLRGPSMSCGSPDSATLALSRLPSSSALGDRGGVEAGITRIVLRSWLLCEPLMEVICPELREDREPFFMGGG